METDIVAGLESGADDYVTKPSTYSAPPVHTRSTSSSRGRVRPRFSTRMRRSFCSVLLKSTLRPSHQMLDEAIRGDFREEAFDETLLSALETKLAHYLSASSVSAVHLREERDKIKSPSSSI